VLRTAEGPSSAQPSGRKGDFHEELRDWDCRDRGGSGPCVRGISFRERQPFVGSFTFTDTNVDAGVSVTCGFTVTETDTDKGRFGVFFDSTGTPVRAQVEVHYTGFFSANGRTVNTAGATLSIFDLNGGETDAGINIRVSLPGRGILYIDRAGDWSSTTAISSPRQALTRAGTATLTVFVRR
jgi:hypothetical protein